MSFKLGKDQDPPLWNASSPNAAEPRSEQPSATAAAPFGGFSLSKGGDSKLYAAQEPVPQVATSDPRGGEPSQVGPAPAPLFQKHAVHSGAGFPPPWASHAPPQGGAAPAGWPSSGPPPFPITPPGALGQSPTAAMTPYWPAAAAAQRPSSNAWESQAQWWIVAALILLTSLAGNLLQFKMLQHRTTQLSRCQGLSSGQETPAPIEGRSDAPSANPAP